VLLLGSFLRDVKAGNNMVQSVDLKAQTLTNYLSAAHAFLQVVLARPVNIYDSQSLARQPRYHPFLGQQLAERRKWAQPAAQKEPFTADMFQWLHDTLLGDPNPTVVFFGRQFCVYDWMRLGLFTGFRISEYGQSRLNAGQRYQVIPDSSDVPPIYRKTPLAFVRGDFLFFDASSHTIDHASLSQRHALNEVRSLEITWRYDKSAHNFTKRRFLLNAHPIFDPVDAGVSIIHRANLIGVPCDEPIGVWRPSTTTTISYRFVKDSDVSRIMREACMHAYQDPAHYMRQHIHQIVPHSNRVTAAVCLKNGGAQNDEIAFKLRWHPTSVPTYLRDCFQAVGTAMEQTIQGALSMTFS
jgi:hypothetical protein